MKNFWIAIVLSTTLFAKIVYAIELNEPITASAIITKPSLSYISKIPKTKEVYLMNIQLTTQQKRLLLSNNSNINNYRKIDNTLPNKVYTGMNGTPVLDQGKHGSCVTFANTAAIDAILGKGDYVSQLCALTLGSYFSEKGAYMGWPLSGWNGATGPIILDRLESFGFINKANEKKGCGGLTDYPRDSTEIGSPMSLDDFHARPNEDVIETLYWDSLLTYAHRLGFNPLDPNQYDGDKLLTNVKQFLAMSASKSKNSVEGILTLGIFLPIDYCYAGACARYHKDNDTWAVTNSMTHIDPIKDKFSLAGHEMVIIGYDDNAIVIDNEGKKHQGLLFLRNSWGDDVGDNGDFYVTYEFFKKFTFEVQMLYKPDFQLFAKDKFNLPQ